MINNYSNVVNFNNKSKSLFLDMDTLFKRRHNSVTMLAETVIGYTDREADIISQLFNLREYAKQSQDFEAKIAAENDFSSSIHDLHVRIFVNPELKDNETIMMLIKEISDIETEIAEKRTHINLTVKEYNERMKTFPVNILSGMLNLEKEGFFKFKKGIKSIKVIRRELSGC